MSLGVQSSWKVHRSCLLLALFTHIDYCSVRQRRLPQSEGHTHREWTKIICVKTQIICKHFSLLATPPYPVSGSNPWQVTHHLYLCCLHPVLGLHLVLLWTWQTLCSVLMLHLCSAEPVSRSYLLCLVHVFHLQIDWTSWRSEMLGILNSNQIQPLLGVLWGTLHSW